MITKSLYPVIVTDDIEKSLDFYTKVFDYSIKHDVTRKDGGKVVVLENPQGLLIELMTVPENGPIKLNVGLNGFRMNVNSIDEALNDLKKGGYEIVTGPLETPTAKSLVIKDNNGVTITLMEHNK